MARPIPVLPLVASITVCRAQCTVAFGALDDSDGEPVLHGAHRVEGFKLDVDVYRSRREPIERTTGVRPIVLRMCS